MHRDEESSPSSPQLEKARVQQRRPNAAKKKEKQWEILTERKQIRKNRTKTETQNENKGLGIKGARY